MMQPLPFKCCLSPCPISPTCGPSLAQGLKGDPGEGKLPLQLFLLIHTPGHPLGTGGSAWPLVPTGRGEGTGGCPEEPRRNRVSTHRNSTPQRRELLLGLYSPSAKPHSLPHHRDTKQSHPCHCPGQQPAFYLPIALERAAAANTSVRAKSPCKQLWSEPLGACNISLGPSRVFSVLFAGWRASTLCARVLDAAGHRALPSSQAAGATCPHSSGRRRAAGMGSTRETHVAGPGRASATDANQPGHVHTAQAWEKSSTPVARSR